MKAPGFFLVDAGVLSQPGDEIFCWRGEHVEPVVGDGIVAAAWPSELDGFHLIISVEVGDYEQAARAVQAPRRPALCSPAEDLRAAELLEDLPGVGPASVADAAVAHAGTGTRAVPACRVP